MRPGTCRTPRLTGAGARRQRVEAEARRQQRAEQALHAKVMKYWNSLGGVIESLDLARKEIERAA